MGREVSEGCGAVCCLIVECGMSCAVVWWSVLCRVLWYGGVLCCVSSVVSCVIVMCCVTLCCTREEYAYIRKVH